MKRATRARPAKTLGNKQGVSSSGRKSSVVHIMAAPKGPRTVSHQRIKAAVEKVFRERPHADG